MITARTAELVALSQAERRAIADLPRSATAHDTHMAGLPCMNAVECGGEEGKTSLAFPLTVTAWNLERCLFPGASAEKIAATGAGVVLLSEMDKGMARTSQGHPTAEVAERLGMTYAYGVEFIELGLGSDTERAFCVDSENKLGFHGNAILSQTALGQPFMIRLAGRRHWFLEPGDQPRMGERMAIGAVLTTTDGPIVAVSTHFESVADAAYRETQLAGLLDALDLTFPKVPVVIGGDLNTGNHIAGDWRDETLFSHAKSRGFQVHGGPDEAMTTRPSLITRWPDRAMKLDWFLTRGLDVSAFRIEPSLDPNGRPLSDHDMIVITLAGIAFTGIR